MSESDLRCYYHTEREATSQCDRCGDYLCAKCVHEHDELLVCARCFEDIRPRDEIGKSAKIACVLNALACSFWLAVLLQYLWRFSMMNRSVSVMIAIPVITMMMSVLAALFALSDMRGRSSLEQLFCSSVVISAGCSAILIATELLTPGVISDTRVLLMGSGGLVLLLMSVVLLGASAWKKARPIWALAVALLAPLMLGAWLFTRLYPLVLILQ